MLKIDWNLKITPGNLLDLVFLLEIVRSEVKYWIVKSLQEYYVMSQSDSAFL